VCLPDLQAKPAATEPVWGTLDAGPGPAPTTATAAPAKDAGIGSLLGPFGLALQTAGLFTSAGAASRKSSSDRTAYEYQAAVESNKAKVLDIQAKDAVQRGQRAEQQVQLRTAALASTQRARFGAAGLDLTEGTPYNLLADTRYMGAIDAGTAADNASSEAWSLRETARSTRANEGLVRWRAGQENPSAAYRNTLLGGAGAVASSWYRLQKDS